MANKTTSEEVASAAIQDTDYFRGVQNALNVKVTYTQVKTWIQNWLPAWLLSSGTTREKLTAPRTYYVRTDGNDSNTGLVNTAGGAFKTPQKAYDVITGTLDLGGQTVNIQVANGTYASANGVNVLNVIQPWTGGGSVGITGDTTTPSNVVWSGTNANCLNLTATLPAVLNVQGFKFTSTTTGNLVSHSGVGVLNFGAMEYGIAGAGAHYHFVIFGAGATLNLGANYTISGNAGCHWYTSNGAIISFVAKTITLTGTPAFTAFSICTRQSEQEVYADTFTGAATGQRYLVDSNSVIFTNAGGATYLPGNSAGAASSGGQYV